MGTTPSVPVTCEILVSSINRENFLLTVNSLIFVQILFLVKDAYALTGKELVLLVFSIFFLISNLSETYFIYTGSCYSILNSNIDLKPLFKKNIKREAAKFNKDFTIYFIAQKEMNFLQF